jgi:peptidoglycan/LPS O-acetylase OafA/YrhL
VYWTLFVELRFYLLFAVVVWAGTTYRRVVLFCSVWLTVSVLAPTWHLPIVELVTIPAYAPYFVAGMAMYLIHRFGPTPLLHGIVGMAWLVAITRLGDRMADLHPGFTVPAWPGYVLVTLFFVVMLVIAHRRADRIQWRWLTVAGALTYPFYLLHQRIGYSLVRTAYRITGAPAWTLIISAMLVIGGLAWLVHRYVERPLAPMLRAALTRSMDAVRRSERAAADTGDRPLPPCPAVSPSVPAGRR